MDLDERTALAMVCAELAALRAERTHQRAENRQLLGRIEERARLRLPIVELLRRLLDADGQELRALSTGLPGLGPGQADEELFGCPDGACDRVCGTTPAGPVPRCPLTGLRMVRP